MQRNRLHCAAQAGAGPQTVVAANLLLMQARALLHAAELQRQHLQQISSGLPQHLPGAPVPTTQQAAAAALGGGGGVQPLGQQQQYGATVLGVRGPGAADAGAGPMRGDGKGASATRVAA